MTLEDLDRWRRGGDEEVYRNLLVAQCRKLAEPLPFLFGEGKSYTALFLPDNLLTGGSIVRRIVSDVPEEDWGSVEVIGWLYQFYISERKDEVFALKKAYDARDIPAATQLFTPHWIVRYLVENSLGRSWLEAHPESGLRAQMPYYLESEGAEKPTPNPALRPEDLTVLDPACGSGHILVYAFDLLFTIYQEQGYPEPSIPALILEHNLHGLEIDERAAQLTSFALMMKAREKSRRILRNPPALHVTQTVPTRGWTLPDVPELHGADWQPLLDAFRDADNLGSLISPPPVDMDVLTAQLGALEASGRQEVSLDAPRLRQLLKQAELLSKPYLAVVANPPYMGGKAFNKTVKDFVTVKYPRSKSDLFACFVERGLTLASKDGFISLIIMDAWMFLSSYQSFRQNLLDQTTIMNLVHMPYEGRGRTSLGVNFGTSAFCLENTYVPAFSSQYSYIRHTEIDDEGVPFEFPVKNKRFGSKLSTDFEKIPGSPIAYWVSERVLEVFEELPKIGNVMFSDGPCKTGDDDYYMRYFWEIAAQKIGFDNAWVLCSKGGEYRKYFGNVVNVIRWSFLDRRHYRENKIARITSESSQRLRGALLIALTYTRSGSLVKTFNLILYLLRFFLSRREQKISFTFFYS